MNKRKDGEKKLYNFPASRLLLVLAAITITVFIAFCLRFGLKFGVGLEAWVNTATYFNNMLSPFLVGTTVILLFMTWKDNKRELELLREQNERHRIKEDNQSLFMAISPKIELAIRKVRDGERSTEVCRLYTVFNNENSTSFEIRNRSVIESTEDLKEFAWGLAVYDLLPSQRIDKSHAIYLHRDLRIPEHSSRKLAELHDISKKLASEIKKKEEARKYRSLSPRPYVRDEHFKQSFCYLLENKRITEIIGNYVGDCSVSFVQYCQLRFGDWESELRQADVIYGQSEAFRDACSNIEFIASLMEMLSDEAQEKQVLSKYIYNHLGRYEIYTFLELTYEYAYSSTHSPFIDYFKASFIEIAKILLVNEKVELYGSRLTTKWNERLTDKIREISDSKCK